ncbi:MAG: putative selenate reductase subunit YgfK, partial [Candidatus Cloacimonadota bacterium]|nr:putative selenate reductase subunit YgfK [Candidatus Cloacimonadota bacterium]
KQNSASLKIFGKLLESPLGPAAGPHTQLTQNIISAYLTGGRFFELKTVQKLDDIEIEKPCIEAKEEGYNTEWSTELSVENAYKEYVKAWFIIHLLHKLFTLSPFPKPQIIFNMSVGYDLEGIKTKKVDSFINKLKDASNEKFFLECKNILKRKIIEDKIKQIPETYIEEISPHISDSITLSTMHGCPPEDQEEICKYFIEEKKLHTFVKLNPTLLGYGFTKNIFANLNFKDIELDEKSFKNDLQYPAAISMIKKLRKFALKHNRKFGVKLSNTLPVKNIKKILPGDEMYMSGKSLFPLTINLANKISFEFEGKLPISFSGGADYFNIKEILRSGIFPITMATNLLKPGGYARLKQLNEIIENELSKFPTKINTGKLNEYCTNILQDNRFKREEVSFRTDDYLPEKLPLFDCVSAPCTNRCPIHQDIPQYIKYIEDEEYEKALETILRKNPLPFITGYICDHKCQLNCTRNFYEDSVLIRDLKKLAAENGFDNLLEKISPSKKKTESKVAIIGAGPAGLAAGYFLAKAGFDVTIFEKNHKPGGTVRYVIPDFRLPESAIINDIKIIEKAGVNFRFDANQNFSIAQLKRKGFEYIFLGIGAGKSQKLKIEGEQEKIISGIDFLKKFKSNSVKLGKNVAIIGGGNSAMDAARAASRLKNVEQVFLLYRRTKEYMPADYEEFKCAMQDGVIFHELISPISYSNGKLKCRKMQLGDFDKSGRRKPEAIPDEFVEFEINNIIAAIGEKVDKTILAKNGISIIAGNSETNTKNVFVGGDALRGPSTVVEAIADGKEVAEKIIQRANLSLAELQQEDEKCDAKHLIEISKKRGVINPAVNYLQNRSEIQTESSRCLECNFVCNRCVEVCPNRANIAIRIDDDNFHNPFQIIHIDGMCNECGNCETFCPLDGKPYKDKFTIFGNESDFAESKNDGIILQKKSCARTKLRIKSEIFDVQIDENYILNSDHNFPEQNRITKLVQQVLKNYSFIIA